MEIILLVIIAVTLSMDAFSLSLAYGTIGLDKKNIILLSCIVGIYHFIMPQNRKFIWNFNIKNN